MSTEVNVSIQEIKVDLGHNKKKKSGPCWGILLYVSVIFRPVKLEVLYGSNPFWFIIIIIIIIQSGWETK